MSSAAARCQKVLVRASLNLATVTCVKLKDDARRELLQPTEGQLAEVARAASRCHDTLTLNPTHSRTWGAAGRCAARAAAADGGAAGGGGARGQPLLQHSNPKPYAQPHVHGGRRTTRGASCCS